MGEGADEGVSSTARERHVARDRGAAVGAVDDEIVTLGLAAYRFVDGGVKKVVARAGAERCAEVGRVFLA